MADIFISYANSDLERVRKLVDALQAEGWSVWWDRHILPGKSWDEVIESALGEARCVIVLWSLSSVASEWVRTEAEDARSRGILVPALLDKVTIPLAFRRIQAADLSGWSGDPSEGGFNNLRQAIHALLAALPQNARRVAAGSDTPPAIRASKSEEERRERERVEAAAKAEEERREREQAKAAAKAEEERRERARAEAAAKAEEERRERERAEAAAKAEEERRERARAQAAAKAEEERRERERAEAAAKAEEERRERERAKAAAEVEAESRQRELVASASPQNGAGATSKSTATRIGRRFWIRVAAVGGGCLLLASVYLLWFGSRPAAINMVSNSTMPWVLSKARLLELLLANLSNSHVANLVDDLGITFSPTPEYLAILGKAGADSALIQKVASAEQFKANPNAHHASGDVYENYQVLYHLERTVELLWEARYPRANANWSPAEKKSLAEVDFEAVRQWQKGENGWLGVVENGAFNTLCGIGLDSRLVVLRLDDGNALHINDEPVDSNNLGGRLEDIFKTRAERLIFVLPSPKSKLSQVVGLIDRIAPRPAARTSSPLRFASRWTSAAVHYRARGHHLARRELFKFTAGAPRTISSTLDWKRHRPGPAQRHRRGDSVSGSSRARPDRRRQLDVYDPGALDPGARKAQRHNNHLQQRFVFGAQRGAGACRRRRRRPQGQSAVRPARACVELHPDRRRHGHARGTRSRNGRIPGRA